MSQSTRHAGSRPGRRLRYTLIIVKITVAAAAAAAVFVAGQATAAVPVAAAAGGCPSRQPVVRCILMTDAGQPQTGLQVADNPGGQPGTPFMVTDSGGAPMTWVNLYGLYSGGDGGKMPGGLVCVTYGTTAVVACLTPQGTLQLRPAGPGGPDGPAVTLRARDIRFLHRLEAGT